MTIREFMEKRSLNARQFAELVGASESSVSLILAGKRSPSAKLAHKIEQATKGKIKLADLLRAA